MLNTRWSSRAVYLLPRPSFVGQDNTLINLILPQ